MTEDFLNYNKMLDNALIGIVKKSLTLVADNGLPGNHFFYITFKTSIKGVIIPDFLYKQYPDSLTIIIQHEYSNLSVNEREFGITLSFNNHNYHIVVPFNAVMVFYDKSVDFSLTFTPYDIVDYVKEEEPELSFKDDNNDGNIISISDFIKRNSSTDGGDDVA